MKNYRIIMTPRARSNLRDIEDYITYQFLMPDISRNLIEGLEESISQLASFPYMFPIIQGKDIHSNHVHRMPYKNYNIFYEVNEIMRAIFILSILYNKRNLNNL